MVDGKESSRRRIRNGLKGSCNVYRFHVLQVSFVCSVMVSIFKCTNLETDWLPSLPFG